MEACGPTLLVLIFGWETWVSRLPDIKESVSMLPDIKTGIDAMNTKFDASTDEQRTFNQEMREHNKLMDTYNLHLERILQKLVEK